MSFLPPDKVRQGLWTDWSYGQVRGPRITTTTNTANIIVAVLAVVVSLASVHLWHLVLFSLYQIRTKKDVEDGLHRQQQALFRSATSPEQTLWDFTKLGWTWRGKTKNSLLRSVGPVLLALIFCFGALAASVTSSFIVDTSAITVLVSSNNCGNYVNTSSPAIFRSYEDLAVSSAQDYAKNCYVKDTPSGLCTKFVNRKLNFTTTPAPCPFSSSICINSTTENPAITLDTGYLDSNNDFGLNAHPGDRVQVRKKTTCAPIKVSGYYSTIDAATIDHFIGEKPFPGEEYFKLEYGIAPGTHGTPVGHYLYDTYKSNFSSTYNIQTEFSGPSFGDLGSFIPIKELRRSDADTSLVWIFSNSLQYQYKVNDPVFSAHKKSFTLYDQSGKIKNLTVYSSDNPFGAVACAEQYQFCITNNCTNLGGIPPPSERAALSLNKNQLATFNVLSHYLLIGDIALISSAQIPLLTSNIIQVEGLQSGYIPDDQWKREVNLWKSFVLSYLQTVVAGRAIGPQVTTNDGSEAQFASPTSAPEKRLCKEQKMTVQGGFANISIFGLAFTIGISGVVVIADLLFLRILVLLGKLNKFNKFWGFDVDSWVQDGVLQLQRKAYEGLGQGTWSRRNKEVPLLERDDQLYKFQREDHKSAGRQCSCATDRIVTSDSESLRSSSREEKNSIPRGQNGEIATRSMVSVNASEGEIGAQAIPLTSEERVLEKSACENLAYSPV